jgi:hypothetical protein
MRVRLRGLQMVKPTLVLSGIAMFIAIEPCFMVQSAPEYRAPMIPSQPAIEAADAQACEQAESTVPCPAKTRPHRYLGAGYKAGDGLGYAGLQLNVSVGPHVTFAAQGSWLYKKFGASGFGMAFTLQILLNGEGKSTPYFSIGYLRYRLAFDHQVTGWGDGTFVNLGYEWKWASGFSVLGGGGILYSGNVSTSDNGRTIILGEDGIKPNLELGVKYMFF